MRELLEALHAWQDDGVPIGRAVVVRTFGSAPRPEGAVLLGAADGRLAGSVSGGCVEGAAFEEIEEARRTGRSRVIRYGISDEQAWDVGLACGGTIDVLVEPVVRPERVTAAESRRRTGRPDAPAARRAAAPSSAPPSGGPARRRRRRSSSTRRAARSRPGAPAVPEELAAAARRRWPRAPPARSPWPTGTSGSSRRSPRGRAWSSWAPSRWPSRSWRWRTRWATRPSSSTAARRSRTASGSRMPTGWSWAGPTRSPSASASGPRTRSRSSPTTSSSTSRPSSRRCGGAAATWGPSAAARRRPTAGRGCWPPA